MSTPATKKAGKHQVGELDDILGAIVEESPTPLQSSDKVKHLGVEKKRQGQLMQAKKMICLLESDLKEQGAAVRAVVVVSVDHRVVSHPVGLVGIIYQLRSTGGACVATAVGILSMSTSKKGNLWLPLDRYVVKAGPEEDCNIPPVLAVIRARILSGEYVDDGNMPRVTIQQAHQAVIQSGSPTGKGRCGCSGGNCKKGRCGCIKKGVKCSSACPCNGNCTANTQNVK
jgi:hypothetical protein